MVPCTHLDVANSWAWALLSRLGLQLLREKVCCGIFMVIVSDALDLTRIEPHRDTIV
jgi:hypothetical protein